MERIRLCIDKEKFCSKPNNDNAAQISMRIAQNVENVNCEAEMKELVNLVGNEGHTFSPTTYKNGVRKAEKFEQMQLLVLDFDGGITYQEVFERAQQYDLPILFSYETFSSSQNDERFRVCFLNDIPILDRRAAKIMKNMLREVFPESDSHDSDVAKIYYGGRKSLYYDSRLPTINAESLCRNMTIYLQDKYSGNYKRELYKFAHNNNIALNKNKMLNISKYKCDTEGSDIIQTDERSPEPFITIKGNGEISSNYCYRIFLDGTQKYSVENSKKILGNHNEYRSDMIPLIHSKCRLYGDLESGNRKLSHEELFGLATNMIHVETGIKLFLRLLKEHEYFEDKPNKYDKWKKNLAYIDKNKYKCQSCEEFCPYADTCVHTQNILLSCKVSHIRIPSYKEEFVSIEEVAEDLDKYLSMAINAEDTNVYVIKAQTAIGKTSAYIKQMEESNIRCLVAAPTNLLKNEIAARARDKGIAVTVTPSIHEIENEMPDDVWGKICYLYESGQYKKVDTYIKKVIDRQDIECLKWFEKQKRKVRHSDKHVITTHRKLLYMDTESLNEFGAVLVDEDIVLKSIIPSHISVPLSSLKKAAKKSDDPLLEDKMEKLLKAIKTETLFQLPAFEYKGEWADKSNVVDLPAFCMAKHFYYRDREKEDNIEEDQIVFMQPIMLRPNVKYIIVSATADEKVYKYIFGERLRFCECRRARYTGVLNQYVSKSCSRASLDRDPELFDRIVKKTKINKLITFKKYNKGSLYIGNLEGSNIYEGEDINVVATPYEAQFLYKLYPYVLGLDCDYDDEMKLQMVTRNGYMFKMNIYQDQILRDFQLWMIESQLEQAVGRARLLRYDCVVNLFSIYPLSQAKIIYDKIGTDSD